MNTVLGIDIGTQGVKIVFYNPEAHEVTAVNSAPLNIYQSSDGAAEQQASWWVQALREALAGVTDTVRQSVMALSVSGQQHGFVPVDASGIVLAPVKLWCDTSTGDECDAIMEAYGGIDACIEELGNPVLPGYTASKVRYLMDRFPDLYARMDGILLPHDYINYYLTGERRAEAGDASGTGFMDVRARQWSEKMLRAIDPDRDLRECLPEIGIANKAIGTLRTAVAEELGLPAGTPVAIGGGDNMMAASGTGNVKPGTVTVSLGTSGTVYAFSDSPVIDPAGNIAAFCSSTGGWLPLLCTMNCTVSTELMRKLIGVDIADFEACVQVAPRGSDGVLTIPFFNGERTPNLPNARGAVFGLNGSNATQPNLLRSAIEGSTYALRFGLDGMQELGLNAERIVLTGGGANSDTWRQVAADIFDAPVTVLANKEGAAFGAALQALGILDDGSSIVDIADEHVSNDVERCCDPRPSAVKFYSESYSEYLRAAEHVAALYG